MHPLLQQLLIAWAGIFTVINLTFGFSEKIRNAGIIDVLWGFSFGVLAIFFALSGEGADARRKALAIVTCLWSIRLGFHLLVRFKKHFPVEDKRYAQLRDKWRENATLKMLGIFHWQGLLIMVFAVIFAVPAWNNSPHLSTLEWAGMGVVVISIFGEAIADWQLTQFKTRCQPKEVCRVGLWNYSRHPNYFFQWLAWVGFFLFACGTTNGWMTIYCPLLMLFLLLKVFGVPANEKQNLLSKGMAYEDYQRTTSCFIPLPPRKTTQ